jgi:hypothetical protein
MGERAGVSASESILPFQEIVILSEAKDLPFAANYASLWFPWNNRREV